MSDKTYTETEAAAILKKAVQDRIAHFESDLKALRAQELQKALVPVHRHKDGSTVSQGVEDVPPGKLGKGELCKGCKKAECSCVKKEELGDAHGKKVEAGLESTATMPDDKVKEVNKPGSTPKTQGSGGHIKKGKGLKSLRKGALESLSKPPVSEAQRRAMGAAAGGNSTLGIPKKVGKEFVAEDKGGKLPEVKKDELDKAGPPMAKPPSGVNMATKVPTSAPKPPPAMAGAPKVGGKAPAAGPKPAPALKTVDKIVVPGTPAGKAKVPAKDRDYDIKADDKKTVYEKKPEKEVKKEEPAPGSKVKANLAAAHAAADRTRARITGDLKPAVAAIPGPKPLGKAGVDPSSARAAMMDASAKAGKPAVASPTAASGAQKLSPASNPARAQMFSQAAAGAFQPQGPVVSGLELDKPKAPGLSSPKAAGVAAPAKKPGIFGRLLGNK